MCVWGGGGGGGGRGGGGEGGHHDLVSPYNVAVSRIVSDVFANDEPYVDFPNPGHTLLPTFLTFSPMGKACLPSNTYYRRMPSFWGPCLSV